MSRFIGKIDNRYFEYSTVVDAPVTYLMTLEDFEVYYQGQYGAQSMVYLPERLARADAKGTSSMDDESLDDMLLGNRWGDNETELTAEEFKQKLIKETLIKET